MTRFAPSRAAVPSPTMPCSRAGGARRRTSGAARAAGFALGMWATALAPPRSHADPAPAATESSEIAALRKQVETLQADLERLQQELGSEQLAQSTAPTADTLGTRPQSTSTQQSQLEKDLAKELGLPSGAQALQASPAQSPAPAVGGGGRTSLNLSLDALFAAGGSSTADIASIETGGHDPSQRGFSVQNVETVLEGAVDPYFRGQGNIVFLFEGPDETSVELEEAYLTSTSLPHNLQLKAGTYFSEFGRLNAQHPHTWDFVDQPLVNGRFLGPDGLRGPGARMSWLMPLPFYSELFLSVQNGLGQTGWSFRNVPGETFFGRPIQERTVQDAGDLLYVPRWAASFDVSDTQTLLFGGSAAFGPNGTGTQTSTQLYDVDLYWKWKPVNAHAGFPFARWQTEAMYRRYEAAAYSADTDGNGTIDLVLPAETLDDWGGYTQILWGFRRGWVTGLRAEYLDGSGGAATQDPMALRRWRVSPNLSWYPTEFSKFRLQFNHDDLDGSPEESVWLQAEFLIGTHGAHKF